MTEFKLPSIDYAALSPILIMLGTALLGVLVEALVPRRLRHVVQLTLALLAVLAALTMVVLSADKRIITAGQALAIDGPSLFLQGAILVLAAMALLLIGDRSVERAGVRRPGRGDRRVGRRPAAGRGTQRPHRGLPAHHVRDRRHADLRGGERPADHVHRAGGLLLPLYLLCALARRRRLLSQEAAMKYFLLGAYASAFFLFGWP
ncbi:hypothetical protein NKG94_33285 [Micromonospora sp. M12]